MVQQRWVTTLNARITLTVCRLKTVSAAMRVLDAEAVVQHYFVHSIVTHTVVAADTPTLKQPP